ncbi:MAG: hypothetical protein KDA63_13185 [Planctomycetales bacterium]|nr:hypothetical protein [Planctomycetales bacterium]
MSIGEKATKVGVQPVRVRRDADVAPAECATTADWFPATTRGQLIAVVVLCSLFLLGTLFPLGHTDLWGHLAYGRLIAESGSLPTDDPFGVTESIYRPLVDLWWLSQVAGYAWYEVCGLEGLSFMHGLLLVALGAGVMCAVRRRGVPLGAAAAAAAATVLIALPALGTLRPQLLAAAMFPWVLVGADLVRRRRHPLVWLPVLFAVWANLHGSFPLGVVVLAVMAADAAIEGWRMTQNVTLVLNDRTVRRLTLLCALSVGATLLNPFGWKLAVAAVEFSRNPVLADISEWQPLRAASLGGLALAVSLAVAAVALTLDWRRLRIRDVALLAMTAAATIASQRMLVWWAVLWAWVTIPHLAHVVAARRKPNNRYDQRDRLQATQRRTALAIVVVLMTLIWSPPTYSLLSGTSRGLGRIASPQTPVHLAVALNELQIAGPMFTPMDWGDFLVWESDARVRPLVYSHVHLLSPQVWSDYLDIAAARPDWLARVDHYGLNYLAVRRNAQFELYVAAVHEPRCQIVYQDQDCVLFEVLPPTADSQYLSTLLRGTSRKRVFTFHNADAAVADSLAKHVCGADTTRPEKSGGVKCIRGNKCGPAPARDIAVVTGLVRNLL